jgi:ribosomal protein S18 acetylase RimI-like enzyme
MVKAKDLKLMRKKLQKSDRLVGDPLKDCSFPEPLVSIFRTPDEKDKEEAGFLLNYMLGANVSDELLEELVGLFEQNMGDFYRNSSWGLDLAEKAEELRHRRSRHLHVYSAKGEKELAAFVHFRFDYDDDEAPSRVVLYLYEIQVNEAYRRQGLGRKLMEMMEYIATTAGLDRILLTVFKQNEAAMNFYIKSLCYAVDESSPSQFGESADFEILTKVLLLT